MLRSWRFRWTAASVPRWVTRYALNTGIGGAGRWRGGLGSIREFEFLTDGGVSIEGDGLGVALGIGLGVGGGVGATLS